MGSHRCKAMAGSDLATSSGFANGVAVPFLEATIDHKQIMMNGWLLLKIPSSRFRSNHYLVISTYIGLFEATTL